LIAVMLKYKTSKPQKIHLQPHSPFFWRLNFVISMFHFQAFYVFSLC
jgi:hypothetical protein